MSDELVYPAVVPARNGTGDIAAELAALRKQLVALEYRTGNSYYGPQLSDDWTSPVQPYRQIVHDSGNHGYLNRVIVGTPTTGLVRIEWATSRYGAVIPTNWSNVNVNQPVSGYYPLRYQIDDAQNMIVKFALEREFEWLILIEHDNIIPDAFFLLMNEWIRQADTPVVSALYYTRSRPSEPLIFRGRGTSFYQDWTHGDIVWCDGVPTGSLLVHCSLLRAMWNEAEEYMVGAERCRRVFETPRKVWHDPESRQYNVLTGTSDLDWCTKVMQGGYFRKAGWAPYAEMEFPFVVDTRNLVRHIDMDGVIYP